MKGQSSWRRTRHNPQNSRAGPSLRSVVRLAEYLGPGASCSGEQTRMDRSHGAGHEGPQPSAGRALGEQDPRLSLVCLTHLAGAQELAVPRKSKTKSETTDPEREGPIKCTGSWQRPGKCQAVSYMLLGEHSELQECAPWWTGRRGGSKGIDTREETFKERPLAVEERTLGPGQWGPQSPVNHASPSLSVP